MTRTRAFTKSVMTGMLTGALLWVALFVSRPSIFPFSFWIRTRWFWSGVARGILLGWIVGVLVGVVIVLGMTVKDRYARTRKREH